MHEIKSLVSRFLSLIIVCFIFCSGCATTDKKEVSNTSKASQDHIDIDLSLSDTMAYSGLSRIYEEPSKYLSQNIRIKGVSTSVVDQTNGKTYYACVISDATACCSLALEYSLKSGNYPKNNETITVTGRFKKYSIGKDEYYTLEDAYLEV